jgi:tetratricopeptide (TPR) repeat protein
LSPEELQARFESLMGEIADYAKPNFVENIAGLESIISEITAAEVPSKTHLEKLHAWFNNEQKQAAFTNSEIKALSGLPVLGYGSPSRILVRDHVGRPRLITGQDLSRITCHAIGPPRGSLDVVRMALGRRGEAALARGRIGDAERAYTEMFRAMRALYGDEQLQFILLVHLASNVYKKNGNMSNAAGMYMQGLRCSQRLYGLKSVNNFTMMTNLAIYYEDIGRLDDAAALYRRSLRGRINAGEKEDALMNIQELSTVYWKMGKNPDALRFIEEAYTGYTQVVGPDHRMTQLTLNNLAAFHFRAGSIERARSLLGSALPAMTRVLGLDDPVTWGSVCNFVMYYEDSNFPPAITQVIEQYMAQNTPASLNVLKGIGDHYGKNGLIRKAMETYRALHGKRMALLGPSHPETWSSLYAYAYALDRLGETGEALKQYRLLVSQPQARSLLPRSQVEGSQAAVQELSRKQAALDKEKVEWGLTTAQKCSRQVCSNSTLRFCSGMSTSRSCHLPTVFLSIDILFRSENTRTYIADKETDYRLQPGAVLLTSVSTRRQVPPRGLHPFGDAHRVHIHDRGEPTGQIFRRQRSRLPLHSAATAPSTEVRVRARRLHQSQELHYHSDIKATFPHSQLPGEPGSGSPIHDSSFGTFRMADAHHIKHALHVE